MEGERPREPYAAADDHGGGRLAGTLAFQRPIFSSSPRQGVITHHPAVPKITATIASAAFLVILFLAAVTWNHAQVFVPRSDGGVLVIYADGDCHSRMQRAALIAEKPGTLVRVHDFENHPQGTIPHTTAPMDYLIAALGRAVRPLDVAGAWISPLLGLLTVLFLWWWSRALDLRPRWPMLLLFAVSPALTHAFALGRPDHQSLLVTITTIALASNFAFVRTARPAWAWTSGAAWGLALWVSWFEPLILLAAQELARAIALRRAAWPSVWQHSLWLTAGIALATWAFEGFRNPWPDSAVRELFPRWATLLGELQGATPTAMFTWTGWLLVPAPLLLAWNYFTNHKKFPDFSPPSVGSAGPADRTRPSAIEVCYDKSRDPLALIVLVLLALVTALAGWQARWSPWLAAVFCLSLPWILQPLRRPWIVWTVFVISLWPVAAAWDARLLPSPQEQSRHQEQVTEAALLAETANFLAAQPRGGVLAPWWISPALARQTGQPHVGGTSHQSLPGSADTARFFLATDDQAAGRLLRERAVRYVVTDDPERIIPTSATLLGVPAPDQPLALRLARGREVPDFLEPVFANAFFRVYKVRDE